MKEQQITLLLYFQAEVNNQSSFQKVDIDVLIDESKNNRICVSLKDINDDLESLYHDRAKEWFPFTLSLKLPGFKLPQTVQVSKLVLIIVI